MVRERESVEARSRVSAVASSDPVAINTGAAVIAVPLLVFLASLITLSPVDGLWVAAGIPAAWAAVRLLGVGGHLQFSEHLSRGRVILADSLILSLSAILVCASLGGNVLMQAVCGVAATLPLYITERVAR